MAAVSDFDQLHPHTAVAAEAESQTMRAEAKSAIDGQTTASEAIRNEMRRMTPAEQVLVAQSMTAAGTDATLPAAKPEINSAGDVTALNFETADHRKLKVDLTDRPGEPHLSTGEQQLPNGTTRAVTTDQDGKLFSVDDSSGGGIRRNPAAPGNAYARILPDGTNEALENVSVNADGALNFSLPGAEGAHERTTERTNEQGDTISEIRQEGKPLVVVTAHTDGTSDITTSVPGTNGTTVAVDLKFDEKQNGINGSMLIQCPDGQTMQFGADFTKHPEALAAFAEASAEAQSGDTMNSDYWMKTLTNWKLPSAERFR